MRKAITLAAALLVLGASTAMAQGSLFLNWNDCAAGSPTHDMTFACNTNSGTPFTLIASVVSPSAMTQFAAATAIIDAHVDDTTLQPWWQTLAGQCRQNVIAMSFDPNLNTSSCADIWAFSTVVGVNTVIQGLHGDNSLRVIGVGAIPAGSEIALAPGDELWVCRVTIARANTTTCTGGCALGACFVFNQVRLQSPSEPLIDITNGAATTGWATWQGGGALNCPGATPTMSRTWGSIKSLYR